MKKLMIMLGVAASAVALQAAQLQWGAAVAGPSYEDFEAGQVAYLLHSDTAGSALATDINQHGSSDISAWTVDNGMKVVDSYTLTDSDVDPSVATFSDVFKRSDADGGVNGYYQYVLFSADGKNFTVMDAGSMSGITDTSAAGDISTDWMNSSNWLGQGGMTGTVTAGGEPVPEPTSVALLALGLAALGLKRKVA